MTLETEALAAAAVAKKRKDAVKKLRGYLRPSAAQTSRSPEERRKAVEALKKVMVCSGCWEKGHWHKDRQCKRFGKPPLPRPAGQQARRPAPKSGFAKRFDGLSAELVVEDVPEGDDQEQLLFAATDELEAQMVSATHKSRSRRGGKRGNTAARLARESKGASVARAEGASSDAHQMSFEYKRPPCARTILSHVRVTPEITVDNTLKQIILLYVCGMFTCTRGFIVDTSGYDQLTLSAPYDKARKKSIQLLCLLLLRCTYSGYFSCSVHYNGNKGQSNC